MSYPDKVAVIEQISAVPCDWELSWESRVDGVENCQLDKSSMLIQGELKDNALKYVMSCRLVLQRRNGSHKQGLESAKRHQNGIDFTYKTDYCDNYPIYRTGQSDADIKSEAF